MKEKYRPKVEYSVGVKGKEEGKMVDEGKCEDWEGEWRKDVMKSWYCVI